MGKKELIILPQIQKTLEKMGYQIKLARLRRNLSANLVAERAGVSRSSVWAVEKGYASVAIGIYASVLNAVGLSKDLLLVAKDDVLGRTM